MNSEELSGRIHEFHDGPTRDIFMRYNHRLVEPPVARAIAIGILEKSSVPPDLLEYVGRAIAFYEAEDSD